jgi:hypothetical protein
MCRWLGILAALRWHVGEKHVNGRERGQKDQKRDQSTHLAAKGDHGYNTCGRVNERKKQSSVKCREEPFGKGLR